MHIYYISYNCIFSLLAVDIPLETSRHQPNGNYKYKSTGNILILVIMHILMLMI